MSDSQPQQAAANQQSKLLRADDILKLQCLSESDKQKSRLIMQNFWNMLQQHPAGTAEHAQARQKLAESSTRFINRERQFRSGKLQVAQQGQQINQGQPSQGGPAGQNAVKQEPLQAATAASTAQAQLAAQASNQPQGRPAGQIDPAILKHVQEFPFQLPMNGPAPGSAEYEAKVKEYRNGYQTMLIRQAGYAENGKKINVQIQERRNAKQDVPQPMLEMKAKIEKEHANVKESVEKFRKLQKSWKDEREQREQQQGQAQSAQKPQAPTPSQQQPQQPPRQLSQPNLTQTQTSPEPQAKTEGGPPAQQQMANQFKNMQGNQQVQNSQAPAALPQQQQQVRPPPPNHTQSMPSNGGSQFPQQGQPQNFHQAPQRPQINPMQANSAAQHQSNNSPHPQSAASNAPGGPPVPLSHQAAVSAANRSYTDPQRTNTPMQLGGSANFGNREREQLNNPKMPIPRHLNTTAPSPVHMGQARPTLQGSTNGAAGPMGQPVIPRPPPYQLEGEGDRVLSKRKLDELVRQVTGSSSEETMTPEVEEAILLMADDFVDKVIDSACKLAKLRESSQLDVRDIQVILERNYNMRIPGYASDEVRTVRKVVPAPGWTAKMNAINAAKVMGGRTDF